MSKLTITALLLSVIGILIAFLVITGSHPQTQIQPVLSPTPVVEKQMESQTVSTSSAEQASSDMITTFMSMSSIQFTPEVPSPFTWRDIYGENTVQGRTTSAKQLSGERVAAIREAFVSNGYQLDSYNEGAGTIIGQSGYGNGTNVCVLNTQVSNYSEVVAAPKSAPLSPSPLTDISVSCGQFKK